MSFAHLDKGVSNTYARVSDRTIGIRMAEYTFGIKGRLQELDKFGRALRMQV